MIGKASKMERIVAASALNYGRVSEGFTAESAGGWFCCVWHSVLLLFGVLARRGVGKANKGFQFPRIMGWRIEGTQAGSKGKERKDEGQSTKGEVAKRQSSRFTAAETGWGGAFFAG
jgi:hypothetical protein